MRRVAVDAGGIVWPHPHSSGDNKLRSYELVVGCAARARRPQGCAATPAEGSGRPVQAVGCQSTSAGLAGLLLAWHAPWPVQVRPVVFAGPERSLMAICDSKPCSWAAESGQVFMRLWCRAALHACLPD